MYFSDLIDKTEKAVSEIGHVVSFDGARPMEIKATDDHFLPGKIITPGRYMMVEMRILIPFTTEDKA